MRSELVDSLGAQIAGFGGVGFNKSRDVNTDFVSFNCTA